MKKILQNMCLNKQFFRFQTVCHVIIAILFFSCKAEKKDTTTTTTTTTQNIKPNIVFILVDDLGHGDVGFNGSKWHETPAIDALAKESLVFDNSYMYPTCSPSRTAIFTGKQSFRTGVYTVPVLEKGTAEENIFSRWTVERKHPIHAEHLAKVGYKSIHVGKYHIVGPYPEKELNMSFPLKEKLKQPDPWDFSWVEKHKTPEIMKYYPEGRGFIKNVGGTYRGDPALEVGGYKSVTGGYFAPFSNPFLGKKSTDEWLTDRLTDEAIEFMDTYKEEPFFINLNYYTVHKPLRSRSEELHKKYMNKPGDSITGQGLGKNKENFAKYASMIESLDENVQRIIDFLDKNGLRENTMIVFSSDNGHNRSTSVNNNLRGYKGDIYEGGIRVPTFVNWKGKVKARRTNTAITCLDYYPTFLELAGVNDYNGDMDGDSFTPLFQEDSSDLESRPLFWHVASQWRHGTCSVIRKGDYKLIQFLATGELELYNLVKDPIESKNLAKKENVIAENMLQELVNWRGQNKVPLPPNSPLTK